MTPRVKNSKEVLYGSLQKALQDVVLKEKKKQDKNFVYGLKLLRKKKEKN